jgi:hypothetical protein
MMGLRNVGFAMQRDGSESELPTRLIEAISWFSFALGVAAAVFYACFLRDFSFLSLVAVIIAISIVIWAAGERGPRSRFLLAIFFGAFGLRLLSTILFHNAARITGGAFSGSPDAWNYDRWANWSVDLWLHGDFPTLSVYYLTGSWDVGFYYILGGTYLMFGASALVGRVLVVLFGALAALVFCVLARDLAGERAGTCAGILYAFWPISILWTGFSILRDSLVWFLMLLSILLVLRVIVGARLAAVSLLATLVVLRFVRPYAAFLIVLGLSIAAVWWLFHFDQRFVRAALILFAIVVAVEAVVATVGDPVMPQMAETYGVTAKQYVMKSLPWYPPPPEMAAPPQSAARPMIGPQRNPGGMSSPMPKSDAVRAPEPAHLTGPGLITNSIRFFLGPFAWTADVPNAGNWQLPAMWLWYVILPAAIAGLFVGLQERPALRVVLLTSLLFTAAFVVAGRGDSYRHREMIMPIFILGFALSVDLVRRHWRAFLLVYSVYLIALAGLIVYHRHTLRQRGMIATLEQPRPESLWVETLFPL